jgi:hypothetical protein
MPAQFAYVTGIIKNLWLKLLLLYQAVPIMGPYLRKRQKMHKPEIYKINPIGPEFKTNALYDRNEELFEGSNPVLSDALLKVLSLHL